MTIEVAFELAILVLVALPALRILSIGSARRELHERPALLGALVGIALLAVAGLSWAALRSPWTLRATTLVVVALCLALAWRARADYGRSRGWPPGSLALSTSLRALGERDFYRRAAALHGAVFKMAQFHQPVACVVGLERGRELLRRHDAHLRVPPAPLSSEVPKGFLRYMKPEDHRAYAPLFRAAFSEPVLAAGRQAAAVAARRQLETLAALCRQDPECGVDPRAAIRPYLWAALLQIFYGELFDADDRLILEACSRDADFARAVGRPSPLARSAMMRFEVLLRKRSAEREPGDVRSVWSELLRQQPGAKVDRTVAGNLFLLLEASLDSIGSTLAWIVKRLGDAPEWLEPLRAEREVAETADPGDQHADLCDRLTTETLRLAQSEYVYRQTAAPIEIEGFRVPAGWLVRICVAESHRLDPPFARPHHFDPERHRGRRLAGADLALFGLDRHACLGARLTFLVCGVFVHELRRYELATVADGPPERGNRHWRHWVPSSQLRIRLTSLRN